MHAYDMEIRTEDMDFYAVGCQCGAVFNITKDDSFAVCPFCDGGVDVRELEEDWRWRKGLFPQVRSH